MALMNRWGKGAAGRNLEHHIVSAQPGAMGAKSLIDKQVRAFFPFGFPPLAGKLRIGLEYLFKRSGLSSKPPAIVFFSENGLSL